MPKKEELAQEYDRLDRELSEVDELLNDMRSTAPTKESLQAFNMLRNRKSQIEKRMNEIIKEI